MKDGTVSGEMAFGVGVLSSVDLAVGVVFKIGVGVAGAAGVEVPLGDYLRKSQPLGILLLDDH